MKTNTINYFNTTKKIQAVKTNTNKASQNLLAVTCKLSHEKLASSQAVCLNIKSNNTAYISNKYLQHKVFESIKITDNFKIDLLTLAYLGAEIFNTTNDNRLTTRGLSNTAPTYEIQFYNNLKLYIYDNDAKSKKYFNILKNYKKSIYSIQYTIATPNKIYLYNLVDLSIYPCYAKKLQAYKLGIGYNPNSKKDCIQTW